MKNEIDIAVSCAFGVESVVKRELLSLGFDAPSLNGRFSFSGDFAALSRLNISLRAADRVFISLASFPAKTFDELYDNLKKCPFGEFIPKNCDVIVSAKSVKSDLFAISALQSVAKRAVMENLSDFYGERIAPSGDAIKMELALFENTATVLLDTSGEGLFKRGYRTLSYEAPIKENLAAAILELSVWNRDKQFIDPFCGSGTFPIEAALLGKNIAPNLNRAFDLFKLKPFDVSIHNEAIMQAKDLERRGEKLDIRGFDISEKAISESLFHLKNAGLSGDVHFQRLDMRDLSTKARYGVIATNPPYGERLLSQNEIRKLYFDFFKVFKSLPDWSLYLITAYPEFERTVKCAADKTRKLYNGNLECRLYQYMGKKPERKI